MPRTSICLVLAAAFLLASCVVRPVSRPDGPDRGPSRHGPERIGRLEIDGRHVLHNRRPGREGAEVYDGDTITTGPRSSARIRLDMGGYVQLDENTDPEFRLVRELGCLLVEIVTGQAFVDARRICISDANIEVALNSRVNLLTDRRSTTLTVIEGSVRMNRPVRLQMRVGYQYTVERGRLLGTRHLGPAAAATAQWTERYFRPAPLAPSPALGWCCDDGRVFRASPGQCQGARGRFYSDARDAERACEARGWCCDEGRVFGATQEQCRRTRGRFYGEQRDAARACEPQGWCCDEGQVFRSSSRQCERADGRFFGGERDAQRACEALGWCCDEGIVARVPMSRCRTMRGVFYRDRADAQRACTASQRGLCCVNDKLSDTTRDRCKRLNGRFWDYKNERIARNVCVELY